MQRLNLGYFNVALGVICRLNFGKGSKQYCEFFSLVFLCDRYSTQSQYKPSNHSIRTPLPISLETQIHAKHVRLVHAQRHAVVLRHGH